jgi:energy-coupling factor transporter ATP-binding protein EcfA2
MGWINGRARPNDGQDIMIPGASVSAPALRPATAQSTATFNNGNVSANPQQPAATAVNPFAKAVKYDAKGRVALIGPAGSGKSYTALMLARTLAGPKGKIAAIDTEHGSLSKYADIFDFDVMELDSFSPESFVSALHAAEAAGYDVFICDSLTHFWYGKDGAHDFVEMAQKRQRDQQAGWKEFRPYERAMVDDMLASPCHVIVTMRTKNAYELQTVNGKEKRVKVGLKPEQRDGMEYEFDLVGYMDEENNFGVDKTRCSDYAQKAFTKPGPKEFEPFVRWLKGSARERLAAAPRIDTGNYPVGTREAAQYVAQQKIASGNPAAPAALAAPWNTLAEAEQFFTSVRERVGETTWREHTDAFGWREPVDIRKAMNSANTGVKVEARKNARELYWILDALAQKEGK